MGAESFAYNASKVCNKIVTEKSKIPHISANFHQILNANEVGCHSYLDTIYIIYARMNEKLFV